MDHPKLEEWKTVWRERRSVTMVYILLRISVVLVMLAQIFNGNFENVFLCVLTLLLFMMPSLILALETADLDGLRPALWIR